MTLWIILTLMTAVAAAALTIPLVRRQEARTDERAATLAVLKDQLTDVDAQVASGAVPPTEAEGLRTEIKRRMLAAGHTPAELKRPFGAKSLGFVAVGLAAVVAVAATALYARMGRPELTAVAAPQPQQQPPATPDIGPMLAQLEARMAANPSDPEGWKLLGGSYFELQRFPEAARAYGKAVALKPGDAVLQSAYGEALVAEGGGQVPPAAVAAFGHAIAADKTDARSQFFLALAKQQAGDAKGAVADWLTLLKQSPADAPWVPRVRQMIEQTAATAKLDVTAQLAALPAPVAAQAAAQGPTPEQVQNAATLSPADRQAMIRGMVDQLAARLQSNPRDEAGWLRLIRARQVLGDAPAAAKAQADAVAAFKDDPAAQARLKAAANSG